jgi:hypothetical protein
MVLVILPLSPIEVSKDSLKIGFDYYKISDVLRVDMDSSYKQPVNNSQRSFSTLKKHIVALKINLNLQKGALKM